eukprot:Pgem_evm1s12240
MPIKKNLIYKYYKIDFTNNQNKQLLTQIKELSTELEENNKANEKNLVLLEEANQVLVNEMNEQLQAMDQQNKDLIQQLQLQYQHN